MISNCICNSKVQYCSVLYDTATLRAQHLYYYCCYMGQTGTFLEITQPLLADGECVCRVGTGTHSHSSDTVAMKTKEGPLHLDYFHSFIRSFGL